jgi:O-antigen ligase
MGDSTAREQARADPPQWLQRAVIAHLAVMIVGLSWWFGGQAPAARQALLLWGTAGGLLFLAGLLSALQSGRAALASTVLLPLGPLLLFDALVIASAFNPSMTPINREGATYFAVTDPPFAWLPSSARPSLSLRELWQFNGIVLSCFNAFFLVQRRRLLRQLLAIAAGNALLLAVFGTFQKLIGADGLWFGLVESPQSRFFATFIYHNHWGAFTLLNSAICLGLLFRAWHRDTHRDIWHSPLTAGAVATLLLAATIPLSSSRSSTLLAAALLMGALAHALARIVRERRAQQRSAAAPVVALSLAALLAVSGIAYLGRDVIAQRARITGEQLAAARESDPASVNRGDYVGTRLRLYRDTWRMAMAHPYTGWGLETYATVFGTYDTSPYSVWYGQRFRPRYTEAHSDWLQAIAETGFVGTALLVALGCAPLWVARRRLLASPVTRYLLAGCGLILLYAWVEFPLANPSVMVGFWACLYIASRYAVLDHAARNGQTKR